MGGRGEERGDGGKVEIPKVEEAEVEKVRIIKRREKFLMRILSSLIIIIIIIIFIIRSGRWRRNGYMIVTV